MGKEQMNKSDLALVLAVDKGYTADVDGNIYSPVGVKLSNRSSKKQGHLSVSLAVNVGGHRSKSVLAHRFVAYFFYRDELFKHQCVRHLNDIPNDNRLSNLALGSFKENRADIPSEKLSAIAKNNAHLLVERSRKLTDEDVKQLRELHKSSNKSYASLAKDFNVSAMTAYRAINKQSWSDL
jgi:hypothetical protein